MQPTSYSFLAISGSLRAKSINTEVLRAAARLAPDNVGIALYDGLAGLPQFNPDDDVEGAVPPPPVRELRAKVKAADALLICSPEYAHGVPGALKNALDWLVSGLEIPYKPIGLVNASPRSVHAQAQLAETLRTMSTVVVPDATITLALSGQQLDAEAIAATAEFAEPIRAALAALISAANEYRREARISPHA